MFKIINKDITTQIVEKKSKFIATLIYVDSVEEAESRLKEIRKKYYDARHNCYAFRVCENGIIVNRSSDDGEPSGTAGGPMLKILEKGDLANVLVVVTRYFGGILLGTGGLVRAYSEATQKALEETQILNAEYGMEFKVEINYNDLELFKYYMKQKGINICKIEYNDTIKVIIEINEIEKEEIVTNLERLQFRILGYNVENCRIIGK